jgi:hypothetical protein
VLAGGRGHRRGARRCHANWNAAKDAFEKQAVHVWKHGSAEKVEPEQATVTGEVRRKRVKDIKAMRFIPDEPVVVLRQPHGGASLGTLDALPAGSGDSRTPRLPGWTGRAKRSVSRQWIGKATSS